MYCKTIALLYIYNFKLEWCPVNLTVLMMYKDKC